MDEANVTRDETESIADPNRDYYHINTLVPYNPYGPLGVGDEVDIGGRSNPYFRFFEKGTIKYPLRNADGSVDPVPVVTFTSRVAQGEIDEPEDYAEFLVNVAWHCATYLSETIWEEVRRREFPRLPSRQRCVWLIPSQAGVRFWLPRMQVSERGVNFRVLRVRVQGRIHRANETYLRQDILPMEEYIRLAQLYWQGVDEEEETEEIIFEGRMRVEEIMPPSFYS
jgi:hypothetical protein